MSKKLDLNDYVCLHPFEYLDVNTYGSYLCCPSWLPEEITDIKSGNPMSITEAWNGPIANKIRQSVLDGTYEFCNHKLCPELSKFSSGKIPDKFIHKNDFCKTESPVPREILYGQDRSCNLKCPSCRPNVIPNEPVHSTRHRIKQTIQNEIEESFGQGIQKILMTGSGDPIYSKIYRDFLINFDKTKYPNLESIQLVTNGVLLTEKMWNSFNCQEYIDMLDISFDAGTKETYENVTRLGGDWDKLIENVEYLASLNDKKRWFIFSYVVSEYNYKEMYQLYKIIQTIFESRNGKNRWDVNYRQHVYWGSGAYTYDEVQRISVFNHTHPEHKNFLKEISKINKLSHASHNFHHLLV
jgi:sulfatase maturation enzyme AslB (radical SAM superfamily)